MFVDTERSLAPNKANGRLSADSLLQMVKETERAKLRVYIGAAAGVGKTYQRLEDAHLLRDQGIDVVIGVIEPHGRVRAYSFFKRADEVIDVDISVDTLRTRLRQGKIYSIEKIEQALNDFFRKGNLAALRELALRQIALHQSVRSRWEIIWKGSVINRFLKEVKGAAVHVVPLDEKSGE